MLILLTIAALSTSVAASGPSPFCKPRTESKMLYHGGPIMTGFPGVYFIFYGCWSDSCGSASNTTTQTILTDLASTIGGTPYFVINAGYPDGSGGAPSGALFYSGSAVDPTYSHGRELTETDLQAIVADSLASNQLPQDPAGIYLVVASADVGSAATGFCTQDAPPHHGRLEFDGSTFRYGFVGNPARCPAAAAPQFVDARGRLKRTPNGNLAGDGMASTVAFLLNVIVTNPMKNAWFDKNGLENAEKCQGTFGNHLYTAANGATANLHLEYRDFLIQQNWVNSARPHCGMTP